MRTIAKVFGVLLVTCFDLGGSAVVVRAWFVRYPVVPRTMPVRAVLAAGSTNRLERLYRETRRERAEYDRWALVYQDVEGAMPWDESLRARSLFADAAAYLASQRSLLAEALPEPPARRVTALDDAESRTAQIESTLAEIAHLLGAYYPRVVIV